jgi:hypothetical protein
MNPHIITNLTLEEMLDAEYLTKYGSSPWTQTGYRYGRKIELLDFFLICGQMASDLFKKLKIVVY